MTNEAKTLGLRIGVTRKIFSMRESSEDFKEIVRMLTELGLSEHECGFFAGMSYAIDGFPGIPEDIKKELMAKVAQEDGDARPD